MDWTDRSLYAIQSAVWDIGQATECFFAFIFRLTHGTQPPRHSGMHFCLQPAHRLGQDVMLSLLVCGTSKKRRHFDWSCVAACGFRRSSWLVRIATLIPDTLYKQEALDSFAWAGTILFTSRPHLLRAPQSLSTTTAFNFE